MYHVAGIALFPFSTKVGKRGRLQFRLQNGANLGDVVAIMDRYCVEHTDVQIEARDNGRFEYEYFIEFIPDADNDEFIKELRAVENITRVRITYKDIVENN